MINLLHFLLACIAGYKIMCPLNQRGGTPYILFSDLCPQSRLKSRNNHQNRRWSKAKNLLLSGQESTLPFSNITIRIIYTTLNMDAVNLLAENIALLYSINQSLDSYKWSVPAAIDIFIVSSFNFGLKSAAVLHLHAFTLLKSYCHTPQMWWAPYHCLLILPITIARCPATAFRRQ